MKNIFTLIFTAFLVNMSIAQATTSAASAIKTGDELLVLKEAAYDFGKIQQGRPVTHEFGIANSSKEILKIENVTASCGCTTPVWKREPVPSGASAQITVGYNAYNEGPFEKTVTITYNGGQSKTLVIKGQVYKAPITPAPENNSLQLLKSSN